MSSRTSADFRDLHLDQTQPRVVLDLIWQAGVSYAEVILQNIVAVGSRVLLGCVCESCSVWSPSWANLTDALSRREPVASLSLLKETDSFHQPCGARGACGHQNMPQRFQCGSYGRCNQRLGLHGLEFELLYPVVIRVLTVLIVSATHQLLPTNANYLNAVTSVFLCTQETYVAPPPRTVFIAHDEGCCDEQKQKTLLPERLCCACSRPRESKIIS